MKTAGPPLTEPPPTVPARSASGPRRRRIHVAFFIDGMAIGGTELNAVRTAERLDRERFQLSVFCHQPDGPLLERYRAADIPVIATPIDGFASRSALRQGRRVVRLLRELGVDAVHCHDMYSNVFGTACARLARVPVVITSRRWWLDIPSRALREANRLAYRASSRVLANSPSVGRLVLETEGVPARRLTVVTNFVDDEAFDRLPPHAIAEWRARHGIPVGAFVVGAVANLRPVKDHATLLRACAGDSPVGADTHLALVGEGLLRGELTELAASLGLGERVHFTGHLPGLPNPHQLFDVSVLCSLQEGFPNSVVEAMAAGRPVVASDVGGIPDAVRHGVTGFLVPTGSPRELGEAIGRLRADPALRESFGAAGRRVARESYSADAVLPSLVELYETLSAAAVTR